MTYYLNLLLTSWFSWWLMTIIILSFTHLTFVESIQVLYPFVCVFVCLVCTGCIHSCTCSSVCLCAFAWENMSVFWSHYFGVTLFSMHIICMLIYDCAYMWGVHSHVCMYVEAKSWYLKTSKITLNSIHLERVSQMNSEVIYIYMLRLTSYPFLRIPYKFEGFSKETTEMMASWLGERFLLSTWGSLPWPPFRAERKGRERGRLTIAKAREEEMAVRRAG